MRRRTRWVATFVMVCLAAAGGFYIGVQYSQARVLQERVATGTVQKVQVLLDFGAKLPDDARMAVAAELPSLVATLDSVLNSPRVLFVDYEQMKDARDRGLAYLKVYPPKRTAAPGGRELEGALAKIGFYTNPTADGWERNEEVAASEAKVAALLERFEPEALEPAAQQVYQGLLKQQKK